MSGELLQTPIVRGSTRLVSLALVLAASCTSEPGLAPLDRLELPTGLALDPAGEFLFVTNGNWDRSHAGSSLLALDLVALEQGLAAPLPAGAALSRERPCRMHADDPRLECDPELLVVVASDGSTGVRLPSGAGNIAIDRPSGEQGPLRLLIPSRHEPFVNWVDVFGPGFGGEPGSTLRYECEQDDQRRCGSGSRVRVGGDPSRLSLAGAGRRFAYLPHLIGRRLTLLGLEGTPEVVDVEPEFFRLDDLFDSSLGGGFAALERPCSVEQDNAPSTSLECSRPFVLTSQRFWPGTRELTVAPGLDVLIPGREHEVVAANLEAAEPKPLLAGLAFEDPERGDRLLVVHTTPPGLSRLDTSLDDEGLPKLALLATVPLCSNPNLVVVHRSAQGQALALVSCYGDDELAVIDLGVFVQVATIAVGDGPNELLLDPARERLWVANTAESTLSLIDLSLGSPRYLSELATLGLATPTRAND